MNIKRRHWGNGLYEIMTCFHRMFTLISMLTFVESAIQYAINCKWANEGCHHDKQCCSGRCVQEHPGTNPRCTATDLGGLCLFNFHCGQSMQCGTNYQCCAIHWGTCSEDKDCCQRYHKCMKTKGFVYKKCRMQNHALLPKASAETVVNKCTVLLYSMASILYLL